MPKPNSRTLRKIKNNPSLLLKLGYRRVSNSSCAIARVDRPDWQKAIYDINPLMLLSADGGADYFRRNLSEDCIKVDESVYRLIPGSNHDSTGFIDEHGDDVRSKVVLIAHDEIVVKASSVEETPVKPNFIERIKALFT